MEQLLRAGQVLLPARQNESLLTLKDLERAGIYKMNDYRYQLMREAVGHMPRATTDQRKQVVLNFIQDFLKEHHPTMRWMNFEEVLPQHLQLLRPYIKDIAVGLYLWLEEAPLIGNKLIEYNDEDT